VLTRIHPAPQEVQFVTFDYTVGFTMPSFMTVDASRANPSLLANATG